MQQLTQGTSRNAILRITWPIFVETLLRMLLGNVDTIMLSHYSEKAVAAVGTVNQIFSMVIIMYSVVSTGTTIVISQYLGAGQADKAKKIGTYACLLNLSFGLVISLLLVIFAEPILLIMNLPPELLGYGTEFLTIIGGFSFLQAFLSANAAILRSYGNTRTAMFVALGMNVLNIAGNSIALYGFFGLPVLGVKGVAFSTAFSQLVAFLVTFVIVARKLKLLAPVRSIIKIDKELVLPILKIGLPSAGEQFVFQLSTIAITFIITFMGTEALTTRIMTFNIMWFIMVSGMSLGQGTQILVGHLVGAGETEKAYKVCFKSCRMGLTIALILASIVFLSGKFLLGLFTDNENIISVGSKLLAITFFLETGRTINLIVISSLKATGDVKFPVMMGMLSPWGIAVPIAYILGLRFGFGLFGVWIAFSCDEWTRAILMIFRWRSGVWKNKGLFVSKTKGAELYEE